MSKEVEYEMFRCPCGASGLYNTENRGHIVEAFCPPTLNVSFVCPAEPGTANEAEQCPHVSTCKYCKLLETLPKGFEWDQVCGWEEAEKKRFEDTADDLLDSIYAELDDLFEKEEKWLSKKIVSKLP